MSHSKDYSAMSCRSFLQAITCTNSLLQWFIHVHTV